jgi:hypothetical protein
MNIQEAFQRAIQAIRNGDRTTGRRLLAQVLRADGRNVPAWLWMSAAVEDDDHRRDCLRRALAIDPDNEFARAGLARLAAQQSNPATRSAPHPLPDRSEPVPDQPPPSSDEPSAPAQGFILAVPIDPGPGVLAEMSESSLATRSEGSASPRQRREADDLDEKTRHVQGYRYLMLAGAMTLSMLCGIALLVATLTTVVPRAQERLKPTPEPVLYTATLWCPPCAQAGTPVILWEKVGDGVSRGAKAGELPHDTAVSVLAEAWSEAEGSTYFKVAAQDQKGWVPETFIARP